MFKFSSEPVSYCTIPDSIDWQANGEGLGWENHMINLLFCSLFLMAM